jgi:UDP-N-acetylglucosamine--N-acetylmuramyl-(pentapeptide) pyrophosphoryl-undecaprenol N-acetylglucosamine transferase
VSDGVEGRETRGHGTDAKTLLIAGGGTGGHVFPALAIAREWLRRNGPESLEGTEPKDSGSGYLKERRVVLVGTERGIEAKLVPQTGLPIEFIRAAGLKGIGGMKFLRNAAMLPAGLWDSEKILHRYRCNVALGVGGYASGPVMLLAAAHRIPTVVFEPNVEPGFANRVLAGMATRVAVAHHETAERFGSKSVLTGVPIRPEFFQISPKEHRAPYTILITGGSRGALPINRAVIESLERLTVRKNQLFIVHQTGERDYNAVRVAYERCEFQAEVLPFIENMAERFAPDHRVLGRR